MRAYSLGLLGHRGYMFESHLMLWYPVLRVVMRWDNTPVSVLILNRQGPPYWVRVGRRRADYNSPYIIRGWTTLCRLGNLWGQFFFFILRIRSSQCHQCLPSNSSPCRSLLQFSSSICRHSSVSVHSQYRGADKSLVRPNWKNNWKVAIFRPTRWSLLPQPSELCLSGLQKLEFGRCGLFPSWSG